MSILHVSLAALSTLAPAQESRAIFDALVVVADDEKRMEALIDFQNDGFVDALAYWWTGSTKSSTSYRLFSLVNDGTGAFDVGWEVVHGFVSDGDYPSLRAFTGNLNGDAYEDFIVFVDRSIHVFHSNGLAAPDLVQQIDFPATGQHVLLDLDGDGLDDMAVVAEDGDGWIWMNSGPASDFGLVQASTPQLGKTNELRAGELTGDGVPDILTLSTTSQGSHRLRIHPGNPDGTLGSALVFIPPVHGNPAIGDVDGDGDDDIVVFGSSNYYIVERTGPDTWVLGGLKVGGPAYTLADVDGDGDLDGICCGGGCCYDVYTNEVQSTMRISLNDGSGNFAPSITMPALGSSFIAGAADLDHDGDMDLIGGRSVYYGTGNLVGHPWQDAGTGNSSAISVLDYEGDGDVDLRSFYGHDFRNDGRGQFTQKYSQVGPLGPGWPGDFDGDGHIDFMTRLSDGTPRLSRGDGAGDFLPHEACTPPGVDISFGGGNFIHGVNGLVTDVDLDGDLDVLARGRLGTPKETRILLNDGTGWFDPVQILTDTIAIDVAHVDGDEHLDLIAVQASTHLLGYVPGLGSGLFEQTFVPIPGTEALYGWNELAVDDWNADGNVDIAIPSDDGLNIYWGTGSGAFIEQHVPGPGGVSAYSSVNSSVFSFDLDGDGWKDLMVGRTSGGPAQVLILLRTADGQAFQDPIVQLFHPQAVADFDTDGDADVLHTSEPQYWIPGRTFEGDSAGRHLQYGHGSEGTGGLRPILGAKGPFRAGETVELRLLGGRGGAIAHLKVAFSSSNIEDYPFPGMNAYAEPWSRRLVYSLDGTEGAPGAGRKTITSVVPQALVGKTLYYQFYVLDPGAEFGWSSSNGLEIRYR